MDTLKKLKKSITEQHPIPDSKTAEVNQNLLQLLEEMQRRIKKLEDIIEHVVMK